jgi:hypothetical protein
MYNLVKHNNKLVFFVLFDEWTGRDKSVLRLAMGWLTQPPVQGYWFSLPRLNPPGHDVNHPPLLVPTLEKEYSYTFILPLGLHAIF